MPDTKAASEPLATKADGRETPRRTWAASGVISVGLALLGALVYFALSWGQIHSLPSIIDEGLYLYKGFLFSSGAYVPFQDGGPWTNHMPLSFLIPGWVQAVFGLGLRTGRFYALGVGMLMLTGVWINARRLGGLAWAAAAVWMIALNPFLLDVYGKAQSQVLIACMLAWVLVFTLGPGRPVWQVLVGAGLAGITLGTRINMIFLLPILLAYIFWEYGRRVGGWATATALAVLGGLHLAYWPNILKLWAKWLPGGLTPFLGSWREAATAIPAWDPKVSLEGRLASLRLGVTQNPVLLVGGMAALLMWPAAPWSGSERWVRRAAIFLLSLAAALTALHVWAALGNNYCVYCFTSYLAFFSQLGIYLLVIAGAHWYRRISAGRRIFALLSLLLAGSLLWAPSFETLAKHLRAVRIPRMADSRLLPGETTLAGLIKNLFHVTARTTETVLDVLLLAGALAVLALLLWIGIAWIRRRSVAAPLAGLAAVMGAWLLAFTLGYSTPLTKVCAGDVIRSYELAGQHLARRVPAGSTVYWAASASPAPLLYIPQANIFPAQLNGDYTFRLAGDPADLQRFGSWNAQMASRWVEEADFVLMYQMKPGRGSSQLDLSEFEELEPTPPTLPCQTDSIIRLFRRNR